MRGPQEGEPLARKGKSQSGSCASEVGLVLLELHHEVVDVDELCPGREGPELGLGQHPVEAVVELDQLGQRSLGRERQARVRLWGRTTAGEEQSPRPGRGLCR